MTGVSGSRGAGGERLTERQWLVVRLLADGGAFTATDVAFGIGITRGPHRSGTVWSGQQSPAQYVIGSLTGLERKGLVRLAPRPDRLSGTAYVLTAAGREALSEVSS